jgi:hypothetical protein
LVYGEAAAVDRRRRQPGDACFETRQRIVVEDDAIVGREHHLAAEAPPAARGLRLEVVYGIGVPVDVDLPRVQQLAEHPNPPGN